MKTKRLKQRMYFFVSYSLSGIQKGIQAGHAALEYSELYGTTPEYRDFINNDKTWIILNGGTTNSDSDSEFYGSLNQIADSLRENNIPFAKFHEPDLNMALTAVCFLADELVWDWKYCLSRKDWEREVLAADIEAAQNGHTHLTDEALLRSDYEEYIESRGGTKETVFLKDLLDGKKLA